jgi:hypothetical protein
MLLHSKLYNPFEYTLSFLSHHTNADVDAERCMGYLKDCSTKLNRLLIVSRHREGYVLLFFLNIRVRIVPVWPGKRHSEFV